MAIEKYTAADLAQLAGVSLRTVRYFVSEGLLAAPASRGRGAHFDNAHLAQLKSIRLFQLAGLDNAAIRDHARELEQILAKKGLDVHQAQQAWLSSAWASYVGLERASSEPEDMPENEPQLNIVDAIRIPMADGIELLVCNQIEMPTPRRLVEIALLIRRIFGRR